MAANAVIHAFLKFFCILELPAFSPFPILFSKDISLRVMKTWEYLVTGKKFSPATSCQNTTQNYIHRKHHEKRTENIMGKEQNAGYHHFLFFPMF